MPAPSPLRGLGLVALATLMLALAACGDDESSTVASSTSTDTTPGATKADNNHSSGSGGGGNRGSGRDGFPAPPPSAITPLGGVPVGTVPAGAGPDADAQAVERTVRAYLHFLYIGNGTQACAQFTPEGRDFMERKLAGIAPETAGAPCESSIVLYQGAYENTIKHPRVTNVEVTGNQARAIGPLHQPAVLVKNAGLWQMTRYGND